MDSPRASPALQADQKWIPPRTATRLTRRAGVGHMPGVNFDRAAVFYDATRALPAGVAERVAEAIARTVGAEPRTRFLEVGIGTGRITLPLAQVGYHCYGVDLSAAMLDALRQKLGGSLPAGPVRVGQADAMALPFRRGVFDVVLAVHLLHLVDDAQQALGEIRRVLAPGGRVLISANERGASDETTRGGAPSGWRVVTLRWRAILTELGVDRRQRPRGRWLPDDTVTAALQAERASVARVVLATYRERRIPREIAAVHRDRIYSSDWDTPETIHAEAVRRLMHWLDTTHPAPDDPVDEDAAFTVLVGTF
jgi:SAM-dependent methyltransferase